MKKSLLIIVAILLTSFQFAVAGGNIRLIGSTKNVVRVGETFQVIYELNTEAGGFIQPNFGGLQVLSGPNVSSSSSIQFINGHMSQSYNITYTFLVRATQTGNITISPAYVTVKRRRYTSEKLHVKVVKVSTANTQQRYNGNANNTGSPKSNNSHVSSEDVYVKASVNNAHPWLGQQIIITYEIYTKVPVSNLSIQKLSSYAGFWSKDLLKANAPMKQKNKFINGQQYVIAEIRKLALIPQKTGKLTINPMELDCNVQIRVQPKRRHTRGYDPFGNFFNDPFFNRSVKNVKKTLLSNAVTVYVKPLPQEGKPIGFAGAVGNFRFNTKIDRTQLNANDALTFDVNISGRGNIELIEPPKVKWPVDFETYDPKITSKINTSAYGISGRKKFEFIAVPRNPGDFVILPVTFSFFNPSDGKYHSFASDTLNIHVGKGNGNGNRGVTYSANEQEDIHFLGKDIHHIKSQLGKLRNLGEFFFASTLYYILLILPVILLIILLFIRKMLIKKYSNISRLKNKKAHKIAKTRLSKASKFKKEGNDKAFYEEVAQALWGYISDKFNIPQADLSVDTVKEKLQGISANEESIESFISTLNNIEFARFAPGSAKDKMGQIYLEAMNAILKAEKAIK